MDKENKKYAYFENKIFNLYKVGKHEEAERLINKLGGQFKHLNKSEKQNKNTILRKKTKIVFFSKGDDKFLVDIIRELSKDYEIKKLTITKQEELKLIDQWMAWADICWFEWCDELLIYGSKLPIANNRKIITRIHSYEVFTNYLFQVDWNVINKIIFVARHIKRLFLKKISIEESRTTVIPNGIDINKWNFKNREEGYKIAYVGYINYKKGPMLLLQVFQKLIKKNSNYKLYIAGEFQDERDYLYFHQMIQEFGLDENFFFEGWQDNLDTWLDDKDYILCTSILESQNMSVMQAMAKGIKPIIHNFVGAKDIYNAEYLWNTVDEAVEMVGNGVYSSINYQDFITNNFNFNMHKHAVKRIINEQSKQQVRNNSYNVYNSKNDLSCVPFFIIGSGRSGNTLLRAMLTAHSDISIPPESYVLPVMYDVFINNKSNKWNKIINSVLEPLEKYPDFYTWGISLAPVKEKLISLNKDERSLAKILDEVYMHYAQTHFPGARVWGDKTPLNTLNLPKIDKALPNSKYIHIIRDGRDVVSSYIKAGFYETIEKASLRWLDSIKKAKQFAATKDVGQYLEVKYEELVRSPKKELIRICEFLDVPFESKMLEFYQIYDKLGDTVLKYHDNVKNPVNENSIGKWKRELNKEDKDKVIKLLNQSLEILGYDV